MEQHHRDYLRAYMPKYREKNRERVRRNNRNYMRRKRNKFLREPSKPDTIVGLNYAERQRQKTLALAGKVEL